jgi:hypothetical protein
MLKYNKFAYKKTTDECKVEDRFQKNGQFSVTYMVYAKSQIKRPHITRGAFIFIFPPFRIYLIFIEAFGDLTNTIFNVVWYRNWPVSAHCFYVHAN